MEEKRETEVEVLQDSLGALTGVLEAAKIGLEKSDEVIKEQRRTIALKDGALAEQRRKLFILLWITTAAFVINGVCGIGVGLAVVYVREPSLGAFFVAAPVLGGLQLLAGMTWALFLLEDVFTNVAAPPGNRGRETDHET